LIVIQRHFKPKNKCFEFKSSGVHFARTFHDWFLRFPIRLNNVPNEHYAINIDPQALVMNAIGRGSFEY
jgi:hypothetical protein